MRFNKKIASVLALGAIATFCGGLGVSNAVDAKADVNAIPSFSTVVPAEEYAVGEIFELPTPVDYYGDYYVLIQEVENNELLIKEQIANLKSDNLYSFDTEGEYIISYVYNLDGASVGNKNFPVSVVNKPVFDFSKIPSEVNISDEIEFGNVMFLFNGETAVASLDVVAPNGNSVDVTSGVFSPRQIGTYTFTASVNFNEQLYSKEYSVKVEADASKLFESEDEFICVENFSLPSWSVPGNGVLVSTSTPSASIRYANVIDLSTIGADTDLLQFQVMYGEDEQTGLTFCDMGSGWNGGHLYLTIRFTDIYDESKYIDFAWRSGEYYVNNATWQKGICYMVTGSSGYELTKYFGQLSGTAITNNTFFGAEAKKLYGNTGFLFNMAYDYETNTSYYKNRYNSNVKQSALADYSDTNFWGEYAFDKFTTGEVYMDIRFGSGLDGQGGIVVTSIAGNSLSGTKVDNPNQTVASNLKDTVKPEISVLMEEEYFDAMPTGYVGVSYPVPEAYALDVICGACDVVATVSKGSNVYPIVDGKFVPDVAGTYTLNYFAKDAFGNEENRSFTITVKDEAVPKINFAFAEEVKAYYGSSIKIPEIIVSGGSGNVEYSYDIYYNGTEVQLNDQKELTLDQVGEIELRFTATDYLGTAMESGKITVSVIAGSNVVISLTEYLPLYVREGDTIILPDYETICYESNQIYSYIQVNDTMLLADRKYEVTESAGETLYVTYVAIYGQLYESVYEIKVLPAYESVENGLITEGATVALNNGLEFTLEEKASIATPYVMAAEDIDFKFTLTAPTSLQYFDLNLIDAKRTDDSVFLRFYRIASSSTTVEMKINGVGKTYTIPGSFNGSIEFILSFNGLTGGIHNEKGLQVASVNTYSNGVPYLSFTDNLCYVEFNFENASGAKFLLTKLGVQVYDNYSNYLPSGPQIAYSEPMYNATFEKGTTVTLPTAAGYDLYDGYCDVYVSVSGPNSTVLYSTICNQRYSFQMNEYGNYIVSFTSKDKHGGNSTFRFTYEIKDEEGPTITVATDDLKVKVGEELIIPQATVTDNATEEITTYRFIVDSLGEYTKIDADRYTFNKAGTYQIVYVAYDNKDNASRKVINVTVTE